MVSYYKAAYNLYKLYQPSSTAKPASQANIDRTFGPFRPRYRPTLLVRNDDEAQELYNHARTMAFLMDAAPQLSDLGLPFRAGLDDLISLVPLYGDALSALLSLYGVVLAWLFGVPMAILLRMVVNIVIDFIVGLVPILGDFLDNLWKANLRNLELLEEHLLSSPRHNILLMPHTTAFIPSPHKPSGGGMGFFSRKAKENGTRRGGEKGKRTRRMEAWEGSDYAERQRGGGAAGEGDEGKGMNL